MELMIALSVLSTILVMGTVIMAQIGRLYSKGVNAANTQNITRNVIGDVSTAIQFSGASPTTCPYNTAEETACFAGSRDYGTSPTDDIYAICLNTVRYTFVLNRKQGTDVDDTVTPHVLWRDTMDNGSTCQPLNIAEETVLADEASSEPEGQQSKGYDMLSKNMRLNKFRLKETASGTDIYKVDVWVSYGDKDLVKTDGTGCVSATGNQFCAASLQSVTVTRRL